MRRNKGNRPFLKQSPIRKIKTQGFCSRFTVLPVDRIELFNAMVWHLHKYVLREQNLDIFNWDIRFYIDSDIQIRMSNWGDFASSVKKKNLYIDYINIGATRVEFLYLVPNDEFNLTKNMPDSKPRMLVTNFIQRANWKELYQDNNSQPRDTKSNAEAETKISAMLNRNFNSQSFDESDKYAKQIVQKIKQKKTLDSKYLNSHKLYQDAIDIYSEIKQGES